MLRAYPAKGPRSDGDSVEAALAIDQAWAAARSRLTDPRSWARVERVAGALLERQRLDGDEFRSLVTR